MQIASSNMQAAGSGEAPRTCAAGAVPLLGFCLGARRGYPSEAVTPLLPSFPEAGGAALPGAGGCSCNGQDAAAQIAEAVCMCFAAQSVPWQVRRTHSF